MWLGIVSLFPEMFEVVSGFGITGRAVEQGLVTMECWNPRDFAPDRSRTVDDRPYGGGPGMLMKVQPLREAIHAAKQRAAEVDGDGQRALTIYLSPQGRPLDQQLVASLAGRRKLILVAGRYEGIDERLIEAEIDEEISIGDYVLSGGELPAMVIVDSMVRLLPGALGHPDSASQDSFSRGLLDCPHYTRPQDIEGRKVPDVLLSGNHREIEAWRRRQSLLRTWQRRPDLLERLALSEDEERQLEEFSRLFEQIGRHEPT